MPTCTHTHSIDSMQCWAILVEGGQQDGLFLTAVNCTKGVVTCHITKCKSPTQVHPPTHTVCTQSPPSDTHTHTHTHKHTNHTHAYKHTSCSTHSCCNATSSCDGTLQPNGMSRVEGSLQGCRSLTIMSRAWVCDSTWAHIKQEHHIGRKGRCMTTCHWSVCVYVCVWQHLRAFMKSAN